MLALFIFFFPMEYTDDGQSGWRCLAHCLIMWFNLIPNYRFYCIKETQMDGTWNPLSNIFVPSRFLIRNELNSPSVHMHLHLHTQTLHCKSMDAVVECSFFERYPGKWMTRLDTTSLTYNDTIDARTKRIAEFRLTYRRRQQCIQRTFTQTFQ